MKISEIPDQDPFPSKRSGHRLISIQDYLILFGGYTKCAQGGELKREVWCFHIASETWKLLNTNTENFPASTASCAVIPHGNKLIVFGGSGSNFGMSNSDQLNILDMHTLQWEVVTLSGDRMEGGYGHSVSTSPDGCLYLYGGCDGYRYYNSMHKICMTSWNTRSFYRTNHIGRYRHESVDHDGKIYIFGGGNPHAIGELNEIPYFDTQHNKWHVLQSNSTRCPTARLAHSCNKINNLVVIAGGQGQVETPDLLETQAFNDIWIFNLDTCCWAKLEIELPRKLFFHSGAFGSDRRLYIFGGSVYNHRRSVKRLNVLYKANIFVPSLAELSWDIVQECFRDVDSRVLFELGVPEYFLIRKKKLRI